MKYFLLIITSLIALKCEQTPLENYLSNNDDLNYVKSTLIKVNNETNYIRYKLNVTTLKWFNESLSNGSIWWHEMYINVPKNFDKNKPIFFFIDSGDNFANNDQQYVDYVTKLSTQTSCITVSMRQVPNQPIQFYNDPSGKCRREDDLVAWTFNLYLNSKNNQMNTAENNLPLLFPMTKSVKRGMDIVDQFLTKNNINHINKFIVSGISKRGWTAWLITAVDTRVVGAVPIVFDLLNFNKNFHNQYQSLGGAYSFALKDYHSVNLTRILDDIELHGLSKLVDPYTYIEKYKGKSFLLISSSGDEFMMPDNTKLFLKELNIQTNEKTCMRRLPNSDHFLADQTDKIFSSIRGFLATQSNEIKSPKISWKFSNNATHGNIDITISNLDSFDSYQLKAYHAITLRNKKDFRRHILNNKNQVVEQNVNWNTEQGLNNNNFSPNGVYKHRYSLNRNKTNDKYIGFFIEITLKSKNDSTSFVYTTEVNIIPEYNPIGDCNGQECGGILV